MSNVHVRFAPSPTGFLHVGGLRTALYNYLFARHHEGSLILRIEDTDKSREVQGAIQNIVDNLVWAGINYDEGPISEDSAKGDSGPYLQSQRLDLYDQYAKQLVEDNHAYYCFCSEERLEKVRTQQMEFHGRTKYDQHCRKLSDKESHSRLEAGMPHVVRMKIPSDVEADELSFDDAVRGEVTIPYENLDDQILIKSDGFPTYHLANVVDDHLMNISHVIRGEEWLPSTPKHILLYQYFGWDIPVFAHLPLLLNEDRSKLSKRQGDVMVDDYRKQGYLPEALVNFVALLGWSPGSDDEFFSMEELIPMFTLDRIGKSGTVFNVEKLQWMNGVYIRNMDLDALVQTSLPFLDEAGFDTTDSRKMELIIKAIRENLRYFAEILELTQVFQSREISQEIEADPELRDLVTAESAHQVFSALAEEFRQAGQLTSKQFLQIMKAVQKETGVRGKDLWMPVRVALTGEKRGPELSAVVEILGSETCINRLQSLLNA